MRLSLLGLIRLALILGMTTLFANVSLGDLVLNGGFEEPDVGGLDSIYAGEEFNGWFVESGNIDVTKGLQPAEGVQMVDLNGNFAMGEIYQDITTVASQDYTLRFMMAGNPSNPDVKTMDVLWDGNVIASPTFDTSSTTMSNMGWIEHEYTVTATSSTSKLTFRSTTGPSDYGPALDDVSLVNVPEPSTVIMLAMGALGLLAYGWRRRKAV